MIKYNKLYETYGADIEGRVFRSSFSKAGNCNSRKKFEVVSFNIYENYYNSSMEYSQFKIRYLESGITKTYDDIQHLGYYFTEQTDEETTMNTNTLYKNTNNQRFGYIIGKDRSGQTVFQYQDDSQIATLDKSLLEEVVQYTFEFSAYNSTSTKHYAIAEGSVTKGDILSTSDGKLGTVTKLDTKNKSASEFKGRRLTTEAIGDK